MKRSAFHHTKMHRLMRRLSIPQYAAVGVLETLWNLCARESPQGNIGKLLDADIADSIGWAGDPKELIDGLLESGWLEKSCAHRLIVHDWHDHADDTVKKALIRGRLPFLSRIVENCRDMSPLPEPEPEPEPSRSQALPGPMPEPAEKPVDPCMFATVVLTECRIGGRDLRMVLEEVGRAELAHGEDLQVLAEQAVKSWEDYCRAKPRLEYSSGAVKFFGEGLWKHPETWPKIGAKPSAREAKRTAWQEGIE